MAKAQVIVLAGLVLLLAGCATVNIRPEQAAWAESVKEQITQATDTHYVYVAVTDTEEMGIAESLAHQQGKYTQRIKRDGKTLVCVFTYGPKSFK
jgi:hypothetical protein